MQGQIVGFGKELIHRDQENAVLAGDGGGDKWIAADDLQAEAAGATGDFEADPAQAEDAERLAFQLRALQAFLFPLARMHGGVGGGHFARQGQHQADGQLGHGHGVGSGGVHHHDAAAGGGIGVDVVDAHAGAADHAQLGSLLHQRVVHLHGGADHQRVGIGQRRRQPVGELVVGQNFPSRLGRKHGQRRRRNLLRQNDLHCFSLFCCSGGVLVEAHAFLFAQQVKHAQHGRVRLAFAALVFPHRVGMHAQPLRHLVLVEIELLARDDEFFAESEFCHECSGSVAVLSGQLKAAASRVSVAKLMQEREPRYLSTDHC